MYELHRDIFGVLLPMLDSYGYNGIIRSCKKIREICKGFNTIYDIRPSYSAKKYKYEIAYLRGCNPFNIISSAFVVKEFEYSKLLAKKMVKKNGAGTFVNNMMVDEYYEAFNRWGKNKYLSPEFVIKNNINVYVLVISCERLKNLFPEPVVSVARCMKFSKPIRELFTREFNTPGSADPGSVYSLMKFVFLNSKLIPESEKKIMLKHFGHMSTN